MKGEASSHQFSQLGHINAEMLKDLSTGRAQRLIGAGNKIMAISLGLDEFDEIITLEGVHPLPILYSAPLVQPMPEGKVQRHDQRDLSCLYPHHYREAPALDRKLVRFDCESSKLAQDREPRLIDIVRIRFRADSLTGQEMLKMLEPTGYRPATLLEHFFFHDATWYESTWGNYGKVISLGHRRVIGGKEWTIAEHHPHNAHAILDAVETNRLPTTATYLIVRDEKQAAEQ